MNEGVRLAKNKLLFGQSRFVAGEHVLLSLFETELSWRIVKAAIAEENPRGAVWVYEVQSVNEPFRFEYVYDTQIKDIAL